MLVGINATGLKMIGRPPKYMDAPLNVVNNIITAGILRWDMLCVEMVEMGWETFMLNIIIFSFISRSVPSLMHIWSMGFVVNPCPL